MERAFIGDACRFRRSQRLHEICNHGNADEALERFVRQAMGTTSRPLVSHRQTRAAKESGAFGAEVRVNRIGEADHAVKLHGCLGHIDHSQIRLVTTISRHDSLDVTSQSL